MKIIAIAYRDYEGNFCTRPFADEQSAYNFIRPLIYNFLNCEDYDEDYDEDFEDEEETEIIDDEISRLLKYGFTSIDRDDEGDEYLEIAYTVEEF